MESAAPVDGRRARRERGRLAVIDAMIDLVLEGHAPPTAEQVCERAGVSEASLYRYVQTLDDLRRRAIARYFERHDHLMEIPDIGEHGLAHRIRAVVDARLRFYEITEPMAVMTRRQTAEVPELGDALRRVRATFVDQLAHHFDHELGSLRQPMRRERLAVLASLTSFESWQQLRSQGLDQAATARALRRALSDLLDGGDR